MHNLFIVLILFVIFGCQTAPKDGPVTDIGVWDGKVLMTSGMNKNKKWAYVTWASDSSQGRMRVDVRAVMDIPIATFLLTEGEAHLWLYRENKHYTSKEPKKLFSRLIKFELDPEVFFSFLGYPKNIGNSWQCRNGNRQMYCANIEEQLKVSLDFDNADQRKIEVIKPGKAFILKLKRSKVEVADKMFKYQNSSHFESIAI